MPSHRPFSSPDERETSAQPADRTLHVHPPAGRLERWIPALGTLRTYERAWFWKDVGAGVVLTAVLVPVGMGYAQASGLPAICGLYATIGPMLVYAILGPSRVLIVGPDSTLAALIAATVLPLAAGSTERAVLLSGMLAVLSGLICIAAGLARFGFVTALLSKPIRYGYVNGIALTVLVSQLPRLLGFSARGDHWFARVGNIASDVFGGRADLRAMAIGLACLAVIFGCKLFSPRVPGVLLAVVGSIIVVRFFGLDGPEGISVLETLPQGLPMPQLASVTATELQALAIGAAAISLVSFADTSVLAHIYAQRGGYRFRGNQELIALGAANVATGLFQGFAVSASSSRTPVAEAAGARSQLAGVVGAGCIALLLLFAPTLLAGLPHAALAAVVIAACVGYVQLHEVVRLYRLRRSEFVEAVVCFLGVLLLGVVQGIFMAVGLALVTFIWRAWRPYDAVLGRVDGLKGYHDVTRHPTAKRIPGLVIFRWDAPLFFANAAIFQDHVLEAVAQAPTPTKWVVVAAEPVTDVDITAADMLAELDRRLEETGIELAFAEMKDPVKDHLKRYGLFTKFGTESFFPTIGQGVDAYVERHGVEWTDWEERGGTKG
jgi:high affinity sulfate transporter 1